MSIIDYLVIALAMGIEALVAMRSCAEQTPIRLTKGLGISLTMAIVYTAFMCAGMAISNLLRFELPEVDRMILFGLFSVVIIKLLFGIRKGHALPAYNIAQYGTSVLLAVATGINVLLIGLGVGFVGNLSTDWLKGGISLMVFVFLFSFWGVMLGRQKIDIRQRRWQLFAVLFLLVIAIKVAFFTD